MPEEQVMIYTIVATGIDVDRGWFPAPEGKASFFDLDAARRELQVLIEEEKETLDSHYDAEEYGEDYWEAYEDGYAAARFTRLQILSSPIKFES